jgi:hypothetical protein
MRIAGILLSVALLVILFGAPMMAGPARQEQGDTVVYSFPWWLTASELAGSVLALALLWRFRKGLGLKPALVLVLLGVGLPLVTLPTLLWGFVLVDDGHFESRDWAGASLARSDVRFADLAQIRRLVSVNADGVARTTALVCMPRAGVPASYDANHLLREAAVPDILLRARRRNIPITEERRRQ